MLFLASIEAKGKTFEVIKNSIFLPARWPSVHLYYKRLPVGVLIENLFGVDISYVEKGMHYHTLII